MHKSVALSDFSSQLAAAAASLPVSNLPNTQQSAVASNPMSVNSFFPVDAAQRSLSAAARLHSSNAAIPSLPTQGDSVFLFDPTIQCNQLPLQVPYSPLMLDDGFMPGRRRNTTRENTNTLKAWLYEHRKNPYPTKGEKIMLAILTKMSLTQVSTWFANARRRLKKENKLFTSDWPDEDCDSDQTNVERTSSSAADNQNEAVQMSVVSAVNSSEKQHIQPTENNAKTSGESSVPEAMCQKTDASPREKTRNSTGTPTVLSNVDPECDNEDARSHHNILQNDDSASNQTSSELPEKRPRIWSVHDIVRDAKSSTPFTSSTTAVPRSSEAAMNNGAQTSPLSVQTLHDIWRCQSLIYANHWPLLSQYLQQTDMAQRNRTALTQEAILRTLLQQQGNSQ